MMPVVRGPAATARLVFWYVSIVLLAVTLVPGAIGTFGTGRTWRGPRSWEECCARLPGGSGGTARRARWPAFPFLAALPRAAVRRRRDRCGRALNPRGNRADGRTGRACQRGPPRGGAAAAPIPTAWWLSTGALPAGDLARFTMITVIVMVSHYPDMAVGHDGKASGRIADGGSAVGVSWWPRAIAASGR